MKAWWEESYRSLARWMTDFFRQDWYAKEGAMMRRWYPIVGCVVAGMLIAGGYLAGSRHLLSPAPLAAADDCQTFAETGFPVCGAFLTYWKSHGGLAQQGFPISAPFQEKSDTDGKTYTVQYFERAVFEAHPENQPPNDVLLSLLGSQKYKTKYPSGGPAAAPAATAPTGATQAAASPAVSGGLSVAKSGFGQKGKSVSIAFLVDNGGPTLEDSQYQIAAYGGGGTVLGSDSGYISLILSAQRLGIAKDIYLNADTPVTRIDVQVKAGKAATKTYPPAFTSSNVAYQPDKDYPKVSGIIKSAYPTDVKNVRVSAIVYDAAGNIIGGGYTFVDFIPANGQSAAQTSVTTSATVARAEMYAMLSSLS